MPQRTLTMPLLWAQDSFSGVWRFSLGWAGKQNSFRAHMIFVFIYILNAVWWVWVLCLVAQSWPTLCNPMNCSPPSSSVYGDFSRQEYWSGLPSPPPGGLPNSGTEPRSPALQADSLPAELPGEPWVWVKVKVVQSCLTLCDPVDYTVHEVL